LPIRGEKDYLDQRSWITEKMQKSLPVKGQRTEVSIHPRKKLKGKRNAFAR